jgi:hypothetical protein
MPTTVPDKVVRARRQRRLLLAEVTPIAATIFYLLLLAWNMATLEPIFGSSFAPAWRPGEYNPMEPGHRTQHGPSWPAWPAER